MPVRGPQIHEDNCSRSKSVTNDYQQPIKVTGTRIWLSMKGIVPSVLYVVCGHCNTWLLLLPTHDLQNVQKGKNAAQTANLSAIKPSQAVQAPWVRMGCLWFAFVETSSYSWQTVANIDLMQYEIDTIMCILAFIRRIFAEQLLYEGTLDTERCRETDTLKQDTITYEQQIKSITLVSCWKLVSGACIQITRTAQIEI